MERQEIIQVCKTNKNIMKWLENQDIKKIILFKDNLKTWYLINDKVYFTFDITKTYNKQHNYLRVLKATSNIVKYANNNGEIK